MPGQTLGKQIKAERERLGLSRRAFAYKLNPENPESARRSLYFWETGSRSPSAENRQALAEALGLSSSFFNGDES